MENENLTQSNEKKLKNPVVIGAIVLVLAFLSWRSYANYSACVSLCTAGAGFYEAGASLGEGEMGKKMKDFAASMGDVCKSQCSWSPF